MPPKGTQHRQRQRQRRGSSGNTNSEIPLQRPCTNEELEGLREKIAEQFNWKDGPRDFQMRAINAQLQMRDVLVHAGTGLGKTAVAAGPHVHPNARGRITIMVSPLIALHDEMVETFRDEFKLRATAVNSSNGGCTPNKLKKITQGEWQIVLISPELLLSRRFIQDVLKDAEFKRRVLSVVIDEAHVISHWGSGFRKKYGELGMVRSFLPKSTPIVAVSATLAARVRRDVLRVLRFHQDEYEDIDVGNDRPTVSIVVRAIQNPINTYADLDFIIDRLSENPNDLQKTFVYCDNIVMGTAIIDHLTDLLPPHLRELGIIRPYNACFSKVYRHAVMNEFRTGRVRILVCTDAAGMGCNLPDVDLVVQWKLPKSISAFVQRAGRAARAFGRKGLAVLLAEPSAYSIVLNEYGVKPKSKEKGGKGTTPVEKPLTEETKAKRNHAIARGGKRGGADKKNDVILVRDRPAIDAEAEDEGLLSFVQSGTCRRAILSEIYGNKNTVLEVPCCDICDPLLLNKTRPGEGPSSAKRQKKVKVGKPSTMVQDALHTWRLGIKYRDFRHTLLSFEAILSDKLIVLLSSVGPIETREHMSTLLSGEWGWEKNYGDELYLCMLGLNISSVTPLALKPRQVGVKRKNDDVAAEPVGRKKRALTPSTSAGTTNGQHEFRIPGYLNAGAHIQPPSLLQFSVALQTSIAIEPPTTWPRNFIRTSTGEQADDWDKQDGLDI